VIDGREPGLPDAILLRSVRRTGPTFYVVATLLLGVIAFGIYAYRTQVRAGLGVTGMNRPVFWGLYITNFVFFIGISHAGTLISAILRLCKAEWRRPITRAAETITVIVLVIGMGNILLDIGRPDRVLFVLRHGQLRSPLLWDVCCVTVYFTASISYLYLPLIPDFAILRDQGGKRAWLYRILALGWSGTRRQHRILERLIAVFAIAVVPIAVSVHTVVSYVFSMTVQPMWHSAIFGPYFVVGAIFSGIAALIIVLAVLRRIYHLQDYLKPVHFSNLGKLLLVMSLLWLYFTFCEYLTVYYGGEPSHLSIYYSKLTGEFSPSFWAMVCT
jgi:Ni/Fe-hydrogenase subunit HybB-like protein